MAELGIEFEPKRRKSAGMSGARKAAILLVAVGEDVAKEILRALPEADVQRLTEELADLRSIPPAVSAEVLEEFWQLLETQNYLVHGGLDYASRLLVETFGKQRAEDVLMLVRRSQEEAQGNLAKLQRTDPQQLGKLLDGALRSRNAIRNFMTQKADENVSYGDSLRKLAVLAAEV